MRSVDSPRASIIYAAHSQKQTVQSTVHIRPSPSVFRVTSHSTDSRPCDTPPNAEQAAAPTWRPRARRVRAPTAWRSVDARSLMSLPSRLPNLSHAQLLEIAVHGCEGSPELKNKADALIAKVARTTSRSRVSRSRLANFRAKFSHAQLLEIAVEACEGSRELKNKADALIAQVAPLPAWCVDILLSPDLLPQFFSSLGLSEHAAAGVCTTWSRAYSKQLRRCRYIDPRAARELADVPYGPNGLCMLPGGVLAISSCGPNGRGGVSFVALRNDTDPQALAACEASSLATQPLVWPMGMALTNDGLLVCNDHPSTALFKFAKDGEMDELATVPALANDQGYHRCAVHEQTQRTYAMTNPVDEVGFAANQRLVLFDASLQVVATVEDTGDGPENSREDYGPICDVAVHGDQVIVLTSPDHPEGSGLRLLDLDGRYLRTIAAGLFEAPHAVAASHGRIFVIDGEEDEEDKWYGKVVDKLLFVIDIQSGDIVQRARLDFTGAISAILVDGDEIFISLFDDTEVVVLQFAGSEA